MVEEPSEPTPEIVSPTRGRRRWLLLLLVAVAVGAAVYFNWRSTVGGRPELEAWFPPSVSNEVKHEIGSFGWNRFRGPNGTGLIQDPAVPLTWSDDKNLAWKTPIPGDGSSSPVVVGDAVVVTSYTRNDDESPEVTELTRHVHCVDRVTGKVRWSKAFKAALPEGRYEGPGLPVHGYASSSPATDGERIFVFFGKSGVYCLDLEGNQLWHAKVGDKLNRMGWGSCSSPILYANMLIVNAGEESGSLIALNKETGDEIWRSTAPRFSFSFGTPALAEVDGQAEIVVGAVGEVWGINPTTGKLLWYATTPIDNNCSPSVVVDGKFVYVSGGFGGKATVCVEAGGRGDVSDSMVRWTSKHTPYVPTPIVVGGKLCWVEKARFFCLDATTGELLSRGRLPAKIGGPNAGNNGSAIAINGKIYLQTCVKGVVVLDGADSLSLLHHNQLSDESRSNATPAVDDGQLFLRSDDNLFCVASTPSP